MKNIFDILASNGIEVEEDKKQKITREVAENYKTINEHNNVIDKLNDEVKTKNDTINELNEKINSLDDSTEVEELKKKVSDYEKAEEERKSKAEEEARITELRTRFDPLKGENTYLSKYVEDGVFVDWQKALSDKANAGKSDKEIYEAIVKEQNIYASPNERFTSPSGSKEKDKKTTFRNFF